MSRWPVALLLVAALAGCTQESRVEPIGPVVARSPFADCAGLTTAPSAPARPSGEVLLDRLPELELSCLAGGDTVRVDALRGPAVLNFWGSWCGPCRAELPAVQAYADRATGLVHVLGIDTKDRQSSAEELGRELGFRFPSLFDPQQSLLSAINQAGLGAAGLPTTVLIDAEGRVRGVHQTTALDEAQLDRFVRDGLGVSVP